MMGAGMKQIKDGYKETSIGVLPEEWDVVRLFDISKNKGEYGIGAKWILRGGGATQSPEIEPGDPLYGATAPKEGASA